jgi:hypothetical protein
MEEYGENRELIAIVKCGEATRGIFKHQTSRVLGARRPIHISELVPMRLERANYIREGRWNYDGKGQVRGG